MAAAPVHTLIVINIHHTHQHQCLPNEDALSASVVNNRQENTEGFQWSCAYVSAVYSFICVAASHTYRKSLLLTLKSQIMHYLQTNHKEMTVATLCIQIRAHYPPQSVS